MRRIRKFLSCGANPICFELPASNCSKAHAHVDHSENSQQPGRSQSRPAEPEYPCDRLQREAASSLACRSAEPPLRKSSTTDSITSRKSNLGLRFDQCPRGAVPCNLFPLSSKKETPTPMIFMHTSLIGVLRAAAGPPGMDQASKKKITEHRKLMLSRIRSTVSSLSLVDLGNQSGFGLC